MADRDQLIVGVIGTTYGDANLDLIFDSADFVQAFQSGEYEDAAVGQFRLGRRRLERRRRVQFE